MSQLPPQICHHYNNISGCWNSPMCPYLHLCKAHVWNLRHESPCHLNHQIPPRERSILQSAGVNSLHSNILSFIATFCSGKRPPQIRRQLVELPKPCWFYDSPCDDNSDSQCKIGAKCKFLHICSNLQTTDANRCQKCKGSLRHYLTMQEIAKLNSCCFDTSNVSKTLTLYKAIIDSFQNDVTDEEYQSSLKWLSDFYEELSAPYDANPRNGAESTLCEKHETKPCLKKGCPLFKFEGDFLWCIKKVHETKWTPLNDTVMGRLEKAYSDPHKEEANFEWNGSNCVVLFLKDGPKCHVCSGYEVSRGSYECSDAQTWKWYWEEGIAWKYVFPKTALLDLLENFYNFADGVTSWVEYGDVVKSLSLSHILEDFFKSTSSTTHNGKIRGIKLGSNTYTLDFESFIQTNESTGKKRRIRRRPAPASSSHANIAQPIDSQVCYPKWFLDTCENPKAYKLELKDDPEHFSILNTFFYENVPNLKTLDIYRIQNKRLWTKYYVTRQEMRRKLNNEGVNEALLFHGTTSDVVDKIVEQNFDCRLSGTKSGELLGSGIYFTPNIDTARQYARSGSRRCIFISLVLVGSYTLGNKEYRRPPEKENGQLYDSCVDKVKDPDKIAIFDNCQCYPLFYVQF